MIQSFWNYIYHSYNSYGIMNITLFIFFISELPIFFFTLLDIFKLDFLKKYRIHCYDCPHFCSDTKRKERVYPSNSDLWYVFKVSYASVFRIYVPIIIIGAYICKLINFYPYRMDQHLPNFLYIFIELLFITIFGDILFNLLHRFFHTPLLYKRFHKKHHEYRYTFALVHHYVHDLEAFLFLFPPLIPPLIFNSHIIVMWLWMIIAQLAGAIGHSGYKIPFSKFLPTLTPEYHDIHHYEYNKNYGLMYTWIEKLLGTYSDGSHYSK